MSRSLKNVNLKIFCVAFCYNMRKICRQNRHGCWHRYVLPKSLNPHSKLTGLQASSHPGNIPEKFIIIWDLCRFLQPGPGLISSTIFCKKLDFLTVKHNRYVKSKNFKIETYTGLNSQWLKTLRTETFQKSFIKTFCYNNKVTNKVTKRLPKLSNKEMYLTLLI